MDQNLTPLADALKEQAANAFVPFDVPGHKGRLDVLAEYFGERCLQLDKNSRLSIDYLCQPRSVIKKAEALAAELFGACNAFFMVGGTTSSVQAMIMYACSPGEKIILPRNVHSSVINAVILAGAVPVYIDPQIHDALGISLGMRIEDIEACIKQNPEAKAVLVNNPTYYGVCSDICKIIELVHKHGMLLLADEAHGTHFYFGDGLPAAAIHAGADLSAVSMHKTGGSFTQSAILLTANTISKEHITNIINLTRTTSASYILLASLDIARKWLATYGHSAINRMIEMAVSTRARINEIGGYYAFSSEIIDHGSVCDYDRTKLSVNTQNVGLAGIEVYSILRDSYSVQIEFGDMRNILAVSAIGDCQADHDRLVYALKDIQRKYGSNQKRCFSYEYIPPTIVLSPREAFYAKKKSLPINECVGAISSESVMCYPPGIPILAPGELITERIVEHIIYAFEKGCSITGLSESNMLTIIDV